MLGKYILLAWLLLHPFCTVFIPLLPVNLAEDTLFVKLGFGVETDAVL